MNFTARRRKYRIELFRRQQGRCIYCGCRISLDILSVDPYATLDHIKPRSLGGKNTLDNLCLACEPCNHAKGAGYGVIVVDEDRFGF